MALITTAGAVDADSYCTVAEADAYLTSRSGDPFDISGWSSLEDDQKEMRLKIGTRIIDSILPFRGFRATKAQALAFPRIFPEDDLFVDDEDNPLDNSFDTWTDLADYADLIGEDTLPGIPDGLKYAQAEVTFQIVHSHLFTLDAFESGVKGSNLVDFSVSGLKVTEKRTVLPQDPAFQKAKFGAISIVRFYLSKYIARPRGVLI